MSPPAAKSPYAGHRFPAEVISHAVWLYFRFPLSLRMVEEMLAARGIVVSHETVRQWALKFGQEFANRIPPCVRRVVACLGPRNEGARVSENGSIRSAPGDRQGVGGASPLR